MADKIRWGILSTANIGRGVVTPAIQKGENCEVVAVASRSVDRAEAYADELGIPHVFGSYEEMIESGEIDAVYNPLPNDQHAPWSMACADAGIPVLCEKPLALNAEQAQEMVDYFAERNVLLAEAFMWRFHPQHDVAREIIADGSLGEVKVIDSAFTFYMGNPQGNIRMSSERGGGGLMDVGCYCINTMRNLLQEEPDGGHAFAIFDKDSGVDVSLSAVLSFPSGVIGHFDCGFRASHLQMYDIRFEQGRIRVGKAYRPGWDVSAFVDIWRGDEYERVEIPAINQYTLMAEDFADSIINNRPFRYPAEDAVNNMIVIDNLLSSARDEGGYWS